MENKEFLTFFNDLASSNNKIKKTAVANIIDTLQETQDKTKVTDFNGLADESMKVRNMLEKYTNGDLGQELPADINFTIKKYDFHDL